MFIFSPSLHCVLPFLIIFFSCLFENFIYNLPTALPAFFVRTDLFYMKTSLVIYLSHFLLLIVSIKQVIVYWPSFVFFFIFCYHFLSFFLINVELPTRLCSLIPPTIAKNINFISSETYNSR